MKILENIKKNVFPHLQVTASRFYQSCFLLLLLLPPPSPPAHPIPGIQTSWVYESLWAKFCTNAYPFSENYGCFWPLHMSGWLVLVIISHLIVVSYPIFLFNSIYIIYIYTPIASPLYPLYQKNMSHDNSEKWLIMMTKITYCLLSPWCHHFPVTLIRNIFKSPKNSSSVRW